MSTPKYRAQAADVVARLADAHVPPLVHAMLAPVVADAEAFLADALGFQGAWLDARERAANTRRTENGAQPAQRTFGRGTETDGYELLDGAPVGTPVQVANLRAEARQEYIAARFAAWSGPTANDCGTRLTRNQKRALRRQKASTP